MTPSKTVVSLFSVLALLLIFTPSYATTVKLNKGAIFCLFKDLKATEEYAGIYVVSGYDERTVTVTVRNNAKKEFLIQNNLLKEGDWNLNITEDGEYRTCFKNDGKKETVVSFDLYNSGVIGSETGAVTAENIADMARGLKSALNRLRKIRTNLGFEKTRSNIHKKNMKMLLNQIQWSVIFKVVVLMAVAAAQIYILTGFLTKQNKAMV